MPRVTIVTEPTIAVIGEMALNWDDPEGVPKMAEFMKTYAPECFPDGNATQDKLWPHTRLRSPGEELSHNELLVELAGRGCYLSFGMRAGRKDNAGYIANLFGSEGKIPHASVTYHAKLSFFLGGISRNVSAELIRHYVGADRSEEGSPSQESTRFTRHNGWFVIPPRDLDALQVDQFTGEMQQSYDRYDAYLRQELGNYTRQHGDEPKGLDRKRIYEAAARRLPMCSATSLIWTTNPTALDKLFRERCDDASDLEFQRLAKAWRELAYRRWPHLFPAANPCVHKAGT